MNSEPLAAVSDESSDEGYMDYLEMQIDILGDFAASLRERAVELDDHSESSVGMSAAQYQAADIVDLEIEMLVDFLAEERLSHASK